MSIAAFRVRLVRIRVKDDWKPKITDHALLRFIERVDGVNIEAARLRMQTDGLRRAIAVGAGSHTVEGVKLIIVNGKVVTALTANMRPKRETKEADRAARTAWGLTAKQRRIISQMKQLGPIGREDA